MVDSFFDTTLNDL